MVLEHPIGESPHPTLGINADDGRRSRDEDVRAADHLVGMLDVGSANLLDPRSQQQQIVVLGSRPVGDVCLGDDHEQAVVLELPVGVPMGPQHLRAARFEVGKKVGVMHSALAVRLLVTDANFHLVHRRHGLLRGLGRDLRPAVD